MSETKKRRGFPRRFSYLLPSKSAQQLKHALLRGVGQRQRGDRDRLAGGQRLAVRRFLVGVGQREVRRTGLQHVDQVLGEVLTDLHDREVRTQGRRFGAQRGAGSAECCDGLVGRAAVEEVCTRNKRTQSQAAGAVGYTGDAERGFSGLVEGQLESVAVQQVNAVERSILRGVGDLRQNAVVLVQQVRTNGLRARVGDRSYRGRSYRRSRNLNGVSRCATCNRDCLARIVIA